MIDYTLCNMYRRHDKFPLPNLISRFSLKEWKMFRSIQLWIVVKFGSIMGFKITFPPMETISTCLWILFRPGKMPGKKNAEFSHTKGQLISKCLFGVFNFLKKTNENKLTWGIIVVKSNLFVHFWRKWMTPKTISKLTDL